MKRVFTYIVVVTALFSATGLSLFPRQVNALSGSDFKAGRIIDDSIFYNSSTMNHVDIQNFLNSKLPNCDTNGSGSKSYYYNSSTGYTDSSSGGSGATWVTTSRAIYGERWDHWLNLQGLPTVGSKAPYTCLKNFSQNIPGVQADSYCGSGIGSGVKTAAMIINDVAKACGINPQILLVLLQKEQGFITDDWPWTVQYTKATGYYCPDSDLGDDVDANHNNCHDDYEGFFRQMFYGARQYKRYRAEADTRQYRAGRFNRILYSPRAGCPSSDVFIANQATAGLYIYTPYQPNAAALNNLYGEGDDCSAYGNRNFWRLFNDWFGSSITDFKWWSDGYQVWNKTETGRVDPGALIPGEEYVVKVYAQNVGSATWNKTGPTPVLLGTTNPEGHASFLCHESWVSCNRPGYMMSDSASPGGGSDFKFKIRAPYKPGDYREYFKPVAEMVSWFNEGESLGIKVTNPGTYNWQTTGFQVLNENETQFLDPGKLQANSRYIVKMHAINTGTATWRNTGPTPVRIATNNPPGKNSFLCDNATWLWCGRPANMQDAVVPPGGSGDFKFFIRTPATPGAYREYFKPVAEMYTWFADPNESLGIIVN